MVKVENVEFSGVERFPENVDVVLSNQGNNIYLKLKRDDIATNILSEEFFEASKFLPSGVFDEDKSDVSNFFFYIQSPKLTRAWVSTMLKSRKIT